MEKELLLLRKICTNPELTQRDMAKATGISLGSINALLKQLITKGIVKVEKVTKKTVMYQITAQGLKQKAESTYKYVAEAYVFFKELSVKIDELLKNVSKEDVLVLLGHRDEIYELIESKLNEKAIAFKSVNSCEEIRKLTEKHKLYIIMWHPDNYKLIKEVSCNYIDILDCI